MARLGIGIGIRRRKGSWASYWKPQNIELVSYSSGISSPLTAEELLRLDTLLSYWKNGWGCSLLSDCADTIWILSSENQEVSLKNIVKDSHHCTTVNSPIYTANEGFASNGFSSYLRTHYIPSVNSNKFTLNSGSFGIYCRTTRLISASKSHGADNTIGDIRVNPYRLANTQAGKINDTTFQTSNTGSDTAVGMTTMIRTANTSRRLVRNKDSGVLNATPSTSLLTEEMLLCAYSNSGTPAGFDEVQLALGFLTKGLTTNEMTILFDGFEAYLDSKGKGVVS